MEIDMTKVLINLCIMTGFNLQRQRIYNKSTKENRNYASKWLAQETGNSKIPLLAKNMQYTLEEICTVCQIH